MQLSLVGSQHRTVQMDKLSRLRLTLCHILNHPGIIPVRHKADILAVRLPGIGQSFRFRFFPDGRLLQTSQREQDMGQLCLRQGVQHIALVLLPVISPQQQPASGFFIKFYISVVACGNVVAAQLSRFREQLPQLHILVAVHTGIGRPPAFILRNEMVYDKLTEVRTEIKHVMGKPHLFRNLLRVPHVSKTAVCFPCQPDVFVFKHLQGDANYIITRFLQQQCRRTAVHAAAHGH